MKSPACAMCAASRALGEFCPAPVPVFVMSYANPVFTRGVKRFLEECRTAGVAGVIALYTGVSFVCVRALGAAGLAPCLAAARAGKRLLLANKEALVMAGRLMIDAAHRSGAELLPVDSEHCAVFQCVRGESPKHIRRILLTASGGALRDAAPDSIEDASLERVLAHPTWKMGRKITVDSATMMNKGLEVIEAHHLFGTAYDDIRIVVHPQSTVHSMVEFADGSVKAHLGATDMRVPIQYALSHPDRIRPLSLGNRDGDLIINLALFSLNVFCLRVTGRAGAKQKSRVGCDLFGSVHYAGHISKVHGLPFVDSYDKLVYLFR